MHWWQKLLSTKQSHLQLIVLYVVEGKSFPVYSEIAALLCGCPIFNIWSCIWVCSQFGDSEPVVSSVSNTENSLNSKWNVLYLNCTHILSALDGRFLPFRYTGRDGKCTSVTTQKQKSTSGFCLYFSALDWLLHSYSI